MATKQADVNYLQGKRRIKSQNTVYPVMVTSQEDDEQQQLCICDRKRGVLLCTLCKKTFNGRISERCSLHPEVAYLMDARNCAFCGGSVGFLRALESDDQESM